MPKFNLDKIPTYPKSKYTVTEQMSYLKAIANKVGLHDAADAISQLMPELPGLKYACHIEGECIPDCVLDTDSFADCIYAKDFMRKEQCPEWRLIK